MRAASSLPVPVSPWIRMVAGRGATRAMVSRILKDLVDGGYIEIVGKRYIIKTKLPSHY